MAMKDMEDRLRPGTDKSIHSGGALLPSLRLQEWLWLWDLRHIVGK